MFDILMYPFIQNAFFAGTCVAIIAAVVGYFLVLRGLTFSGHALSHIGFAGAAGAVLLGVDPVFGLLAFTVGSGIGIGLISKEVRESDVAIGVIMTFALSLGILFLSIYKGYAERAYSILFGTILGISHFDVMVNVIFCVLCLGVIAFLFRPLLFSSCDPEVAHTRGVPVRLLGILFLIIVAITISISVQVVGILLIFTLLVGPAATAMRIVHSPGKTLILSIALSIAYTWLAIFLAANTLLPVSFFITALAFVIYLPVRLLSPLWLGKKGRELSENLAQERSAQSVPEDMKISVPSR
ncbi:metal ABC transporter permease [Ktedonospora formicarum]|uniref:ABC transporter permease n=1 Tax=Ktedonospora formicarum TaxID=2778364 RepID=A0A8J3I7F7_9CHLR|nr:metal ABC transporter permease [Ktedonospora formicarum]GHO46804.1 ABC transporter permease [Ktedonospora formicarum]